MPTFPSNPTVGQTATVNGRGYRWSGYVWQFIGGDSGNDPRWELFLPPAPTGLTATAGNGQVSLTWTAPTVLAQTPITDYVVQYSSNSGTTWTTFSDGTSATASATVTGLTNGTAYTFRVAGVNGVGQGAYSAASSSVTPTAVVPDPFFSSVSLLLHADGTGSTFVDSSPTPKTIAASGNATQSTAQSKWGGKSAAFDGSGDFLSFADLGLGTSSFVIEMWFRAGAVNQYAQLIGNESGTGGFDPGFTLLLNNDNVGQVAVYTSGGLLVSSSSGDWTDDQWHHVAFVRSGNTFYLYLDGTRHSTGTLSSSFTSPSSMYVGKNNIYSGRDFSGYIDDLRITIGTDRGYTGSTITVPTAAFPDA